jgi:hypothetical protein
MRRTRRWLTPANVLASLALFVALGGTGWAGQVIGHGSIGTAQLARNAVTAPKIAPAAVTESKIAKRAVVGGALGKGAVGSDAIAPGAITADRLAAGVVGSKFSTVRGPAVSLAASNFGQLVSVSCPAGQKAIGGGWDSGYYAKPVSAAPTPDGTGWVVSFQALLNAQVAVVAICVAP